jgi:hypothetical protein
VKRYEVEPRRCTWCGTPDTGWSDVHLLISETGLPFCSTACVEAMENDCQTDILIVAESGSSVVEPFGDVGASERGGAANSQPGSGA